MIQMMEVTLMLFRLFMIIKGYAERKSYEEYLDVGDIETLDEEEGEDDQDLREKIRLSSNSGHVAQLLDSLDKLSQYQSSTKGVCSSLGNTFRSWS